jgi:peptidoglycan/xylan/chitin deacetylase (PgdA/CDA1 family)
MEFAICFAILVWFVIPFLIKRISKYCLQQTCMKGRLIVLTYDDGPGLQVTTSIIRILRNHNATATFFPLGHKLESFSEIVAELIRSGYEIGSHSYRHLHAWKRDPISVFLDIQKGLRVVRTVAECRYYRAPYGKLTLGSLVQVWLQGCRQSWWTIDSTDSWDTPRGVEEILDQVRMQGGGVVLMHDLDRPGMPEHEKFVLDLTQALLELAENEGFRVCKLGEVIS